MSIGLIALLDDVIAIAKFAAVTLDDATVQAAKIASKAAGIVIDDAAVTPRYVVGLASERELPVIGKIAVGSLKNKLLFLLPATLLLSIFFPTAVTPLLMIGGVFLCYEGWHKIADFLRIHEQKLASVSLPALPDVERIEQERVRGAIRTDFILSAEIMAIALSSVSSSPIYLQGATLATVGIGMTVLVYGAVALIVKLDDIGFGLSDSSNRAISSLGRGIVFGMPSFLLGLSIVGMVAMLWVGGGILFHGLHELGVDGPENWLNGIGAQFADIGGGGLGWASKAAVCAVAGIVVGAAVDALIMVMFLPARRVFEKLRAKSISP